MKSTTSRIALAAAMAIGVAVGIAGPSFADVNVLVSVFKDKTVTVNESITIDKEIVLDVTANVAADGAAEAQALANVDNFGNTVDLEDVTYDARIEDSIGSEFGESNIGITQVNQAAGNHQNQGNLVSAALTATGEAFTNAQAEVDQQNGEGNNGGGIGNVVDIVDSTMTATIVDSINFNSGIVQANQDAGNNNNQTNAIAIGAGIETEDLDVVASLSEAALGQSNSGNRVTEGDPLNQDSGADSVEKTASITGSLNNNFGAVIGVNQAAGNNANQGNLVSVAAFVGLDAN